MSEFKAGDTVRILHTPGIPSGMIKDNTGVIVQEGGGEYLGGYFVRVFDTGLNKEVQYFYESNQIAPITQPQTT